MPERLSQAHAGTPATKRAKSHTGCGGMQALGPVGEPCMGGGGYGPRLPLAADWDGVLWLFFCVLVACGVGDYFVAFSLVADSVCELCVVIAGW